MPLEMYKSRTFSGANLLTLFLYGALNVATFFLPLNLVQVQGYNPAEAGLAFLPFTVILAGLSRWAGGLVDRYGPRPPLLVGPSLAGAGFLLMALVGLTSGPSAYWTSFFPAMAIFGLGMAITVAPLTTTVMSALPPRFAGTESGINNAVARIAGVLAIAVMGSVALLTFAGRLEANARVIDLSPQMRQDLKNESARLGLAQVPIGVPAGQAPAVRQVIRLSFVQTYRLVMIICAALAWLSALMTLIFIGGWPRGQPVGKNTGWRQDSDSARSETAP